MPQNRRAIGVSTALECGSALALARRGLGAVCQIRQSLRHRQPGPVVGRGRTQPGGASQRTEPPPFRGSARGAIPPMSVSTLLSVVSTPPLPDALITAGFGGASLLRIPTIESPLGPPAAAAAGVMSRPAVAPPSPPKSMPARCRRLRLGAALTLNLALTPSTAASPHRARDRWSPGPAPTAPHALRAFTTRLRVGRERWLAAGSPHAHTCRLAPPDWDTVRRAGHRRPPSGGPTERNA